jgi:hypothetical protein
LGRGTQADRGGTSKDGRRKRNRSKRQPQAQPQRKQATEWRARCGSRRQYASWDGDQRDLQSAPHSCRRGVWTPRTASHGHDSSQRVEFAASIRCHPSSRRRGAVPRRRFGAEFGTLSSAFGWRRATALAIQWRTVTTQLEFRHQRALRTCVSRATRPPRVGGQRRG